MRSSAKGRAHDCNKSRRPRHPKGGSETEVTGRPQRRGRGRHVICDSPGYGGPGHHGDPPMSDTTVMKVKSAHSPRGPQGQKYLASGIHVAMRLWEGEQPEEAKPPSRRDYETVGYVLSGRAELHLEGQMVLLEPGDSWMVPKGSLHSYKILERFSAVEATAPPAQAHARDENSTSNGAKTLEEPGRTPGSAEGDRETVEEDLRDKEQKGLI